MKNWPKISIVTPSFNTEKYFEQTLESIFNQNYPNLEFIIIDGGSTDNTLDIINKYESKITYWESKPDKGQCHAINKGFARATGDIHYWARCDDPLEPGALSYVANQFKNISSPAWLIGAAHFLGDRGQKRGFYIPNIINKDTFLFWATDWIPPQSVFWNRAMWEKAGPFNESIHYVPDHYLFEKMFNIAAPILTDQTLGSYRFHWESKSLSNMDASRKERLEVITQYIKKEWSEICTADTDIYLEQIAGQHARIVEELGECRSKLQKLGNHKVIGKVLKLWKRFIQPGFEF